MMTLILQTQNTLFRRKRLDIQQLLSQLNSIPIQTKSLCSQRKVEPWSQAWLLQCAPENSLQNKAHLESLGIMKSYDVSWAILQSQCSKVRKSNKR